MSAAITVRLVRLQPRRETIEVEAPDAAAAVSAAIQLASDDGMVLAHSRTWPAFKAQLAAGLPADPENGDRHAMYDHGDCRFIEALPSDWLEEIRLEQADRAMGEVTP